MRFILFLSLFFVFSFSTIAQEFPGVVTDGACNDHVNIDSFRQPSEPTDETLTTFDEVIGVLGALALLGGGGYACYRCHAASAFDHDGVVDDSRDAQVRAQNDRDEEDREEDLNPSSSMADDVTGVVTNSGHFALDQRSLIKKIADVLRNRAYIYSIYQNADQIDYIDGKDPLSENRTCWQNFIRRITKSCYPYDDVEDFKKKNPEYLSKQLEKCQTTVAIHEATIAQHVATLEQNRNLIEQKEKLINDQQSAIVQHAGTVNGHLQTIVQYEERLQNEKQKKEQARPRQIEADRRDKEYVRKVEKLLLRVIDLEDLYAGSPFASRAHENSTSSSSNSSNQNLSPLHLLAEATQYQVMARLEWLQKVADSSEHVNQAEITAGQIKTQMAEAWKADYQLAERLAKLASKKELLWTYWGEAWNDFSDPRRIENKCKSIEEKISDLESAHQNFSQSRQDWFLEGKRIFNDDRSTDAERKAKDLKIVATSSSSNSNNSLASAEKKTKHSIFRNPFSSSHHNSQEKEKEKVTHDLQVETKNDALLERMQKQFSEHVFPFVDQLEKIYAQSYQLLHVTERNALYGYDLIMLLEADLGKKIWNISNLRFYLLATLGYARKATAVVTKHVAATKEALGGTWQQVEKADGDGITYEHQKGGWQECKTEQELQTAVEALKNQNNRFGSREQIHYQQALSNFDESIKQALLTHTLLKIAQEKAMELLAATSFNLEKKRAAFCEAMQELQNPAIFPQELLQEDWSSDDDDS